MRSGICEWIREWFLEGFRTLAHILWSQWTIWNLIKYTILGKMEVVILELRIRIQREKYDFDT